MGVLEPGKLGKNPSLTPFWTGKKIRVFTSLEENSRFRGVAVSKIKKIAFGGLKKQNLSPVAGSKSKIFRLRRAQTAKSFACGGFRKQICSPSTG